MNENLFNLLPERRMYFLRNYIQSVVPFDYDASLELYELLSKMITFCNELGERNNNLMDTTQSLVNFLNEQLQNTREYIIEKFEPIEDIYNTFKADFEKNYNNFTEQVIADYNSFTSEMDTELERYKTNIQATLNNDLNQIRTNNDTKYQELETSLNNVITELRTTVSDMQNTIDTDISSFSTQVNEQLNDIEQKRQDNNTALNNLLNQYKSELDQSINNAISDTNLVPIVSQSLNNYDFTEILSNLYGSVITISEWNTNTPQRYFGTETLYHYNPDTGILTNLATMTETPFNYNSVYLYSGYVYFYRDYVEHITSLKAYIYKFFGQWENYNAYHAATGLGNTYLLNLETNSIEEIYNNTAIDYTQINNKFLRIGVNDYILKIYSIEVSTGMTFIKTYSTTHDVNGTISCLFAYNNEPYYLGVYKTPIGYNFYIANFENDAFVEYLNIPCTYTEDNVRHNLIGKVMQYNNELYFMCKIYNSDKSSYYMGIYKLNMELKNITFINTLYTEVASQRNPYIYEYNIVNGILLCYENNNIHACDLATGQVYSTEFNKVSNVTSNGIINIENNTLTRYTASIINEQLIINLSYSFQTSLPSKIDEITYYSNEYFVHGDGSIDIVSYNRGLAEIPYQRKSDA